MWLDWAGGFTRGRADRGFLRLLACVLACLFAVVVHDMAQNMEVWLFLWSFVAEYYTMIYVRSLLTVRFFPR